MGGLADVLAEVVAGDRPAGVYRWADDQSVTDARDACAGAGWAFGAVDGRAHPGRTALLAAIGTALAFPDWYGRNFDALADCLSDLTVPTLLLWEGWCRLAGEDPQSYVVAVDVLARRTAASPAFVVLLRGEGPEIDPPWLA